MIEREYLVRRQAAIIECALRHDDVHEEYQEKTTEIVKHWIFQVSVSPAWTIYILKPLRTRFWLSTIEESKWYSVTVFDVHIYSKFADRATMFQHVRFDYDNLLETRFRCLIMKHSGLKLPF